MAEKSICSVEGCNKPRLSQEYCAMHLWRLKVHGDLDHKRKPSKRVLFFEGVVLAHDGNDCLKWPFLRNRDGYGLVYLDGRLQIVSRAVCERIYGPPPSLEHQAAHSCGNGHLGCVNPKHLRWATQKENSEDAVAHGVSPRGQRNGQAKLTEDDVRAIRSLKGRMTQSAIAAQYGVNQSQVSYIQSGKWWSHIK